MTEVPPSDITGMLRNFSEPGIIPQSLGATETIKELKFSDLNQIIQPATHQ